MNKAERKGTAYRIRKTLQQMVDKSCAGDIIISSVFVRENGSARIEIEQSSDSVRQLIGDGRP
jgi:hypothetical protein